MDYELCKQLKDAGFPQDFGDVKCLWVTWDGTKNDLGEPMLSLWDREHKPDDAVYYPTLLELIEACGDKFLQIRRSTSDDDWVPDEERWAALGTRFYPLTDDNTLRYEDVTEYGETPEEAVSLLWIAINKKDNE